MNKESLKNNSLFLFAYRFIKVISYKIIYELPLYKIKYSNNLNNFLSDSQIYKLVVSHKGGGGTASYVKNKYGSTPHVLFLENVKTADKDYLYSLRNSDTEKLIYIKQKDLKKLLKIQNTKKIISDLHVISIESYMSLEFILNWFVSLNVPIEYDIHDFHCVWYEAHFFHNGKFLDDESLKKSVLNYVTRRITFSQWHDYWDNFFQHVSKIYVFSNSSKEIFAKYYPEFEDLVEVTPHSLDYIKFEKIKHIPQTFCVGIFGAIYAEDKGCEVVRSFLEFSKNKDYQIFYNGELRSDCMVFAPNIHYMGRYDVNKLNLIIEEQGISSVLFPSVCPETFSYTVSELIHAGIPIAAFNTGAQGEKVSEYEYGEIITEQNNEKILSSLKLAHQKALNCLK